MNIFVGDDSEITFDRDDVITGVQKVYEDYWTGKHQMENKDGFLPILLR